LQLIAAGTETTTSLIGNLLYRLLSDRRWWEKLVADPSLVPAAIEESLRLDAPLQWVLRTSDRDQHVAECPIGAGDRVVLGIQSANRDDATWEPDAEQFAFDRPHPERHLSFGYGIHLCLGAPVARLEARVLLEELVERYPGTILAPGYEWEPWDSTMVRRPQRLDIVPRRARLTSPIANGAV
jgi:cytochrome P450